MNILILVGISGSGKSTWAKDFLAAHNDYICINRDALRLCLTKQSVAYYQRPDVTRIEEMINELTDCILEQANRKGYNVLVDNTNLQVKNLNQFINYPGATFQIKLFEVRSELAKTRVMLREAILDTEAVTYIERQASQYAKVKSHILINHTNNLI